MTCVGPDKHSGPDSQFGSRVQFDSSTTGFGQTGLNSGVSCVLCVFLTCSVALIFLLFLGGVSHGRLLGSLCAGLRVDSADW